jgi:glucosyl-dolichyl phosphate glucuronosyltransferase
MFSSHNGGDDLCRMLDSLARQDLPAAAWELVAVDNASTDRTSEILRSYESRIPITVLEEPINGKNRALNRALDVAKGDFYIFTDDDVIVPENWLLKWREVADAQPEFDLFAGRSKVLWPHEPLQWLLDGADVSVLYAKHRDDIPEGPCHAGTMFGPNMAIRSSVFQDNIRFDTTIGPDGSTNYAMGSDTELAHRLGRQGLKCWFANEPFVNHIIPPKHLEPDWILGRGYRWGRGLAQMGAPYSYSPEDLARRNSLTWLVYPIFLPLVSRTESWRRQWLNAVDRGYEDGTRERHGKKRRWT